MPSTELLATRRSTSSRALVSPGPDDASLLEMLRLAVHVPDHGRLAPWRFVLVRGEARVRLGEVLANRRSAIEPDVAAAVLEKDRQRFVHAPVVVIAIGRIDPQHRIPAQEQLLSGGCACFSLLLAAHALGFGAQWLTGWAAYDDQVATRLGLREHERILGFIHIGSITEPPPERVRPDPRELLDEWHG